MKNLNDISKDSKVVEEKSIGINRISHQSNSQVFTAVKKFAFIIGTALIFAISFRNSLTWHLESFWSASKSKYENIWDNVINGLFSGNKMMLATLGIQGFLFTYFWINAAFFMFLDLYKPAFVRKYKIQENEQVEKKKLWKAVRVCLMNQLVAFLFSFALFYMAQKRGMSYEARDLPTFHWVVFELVVYILVEEVGFYYTHRLGHHPRLYKHFHKIHHEWTAPVSIIGIYCHPLEHIFVNILPLFAGPLLMGSHVATSLMWYCIAITSTQISHAGYHLPFLPSPEAHDYHHLKFMNNFGMLGVLDRFHGTDQQFTKNVAYDRHVLLLNLTPARQLFPDPKKTHNKSE